MKKKLGLIVCIFILNGCANLNSIHRSFNIDENKSQLIDARQRAILVGERYKNVISTDTTLSKIPKIVQVKSKVACAEPSPDVMAAYAAEFAAKGGSAAKASGELAMAMQDSAAFVGMRTPSIQLLRDYSFRLCEAYLSNAISEDSYENLLKRYQKNIVTLYTIEQLTSPFNVPTVALVSQGNTQSDDRLVELQGKRKELSKEISDLDQKIVIENSKGENKDQNIIDQYVVSKQLKSKELKDIEERITVLKGLTINGSNTLINTPKEQRQTLSDDKFEDIVNVIRDLANNTLVDQDFIDICSNVLQDKYGDYNPEGSQLRENCYKYMNITIDNATKQKLLKLNSIN